MTGTSKTITICTDFPIVLKCQLELLVVHSSRISSSKGGSHDFVRDIPAWNERCHAVQTWRTAQKDAATHQSVTEDEVDELQVVLPEEDSHHFICG